MAYKFQLGSANLSGSLTQEGAAEVDALVADSLNVQSGGITNAGSIAGATSIDGSGDLTMGTITMAGFSVDADGDTALKSLKIDDDSTIGTDSDSDMILLDPGADITIASDLDFIISKTSGLQLADGAVTSTAAELNLLDGVSGLVQADFTKLAAVDSTDAELNLVDGSGAGTIVNSKALIYGSAGEVNGTSFELGGQEIIDSDGNFAGNNANFVEITGSALDFSAASVMKLDAIPTQAFNQEDYMFVRDSGSMQAKAIQLSAYATAVAGNGLAASSGVLAVGVDDTGIELNSDALRLKDNGVTLAKMAGLVRGKIIVGDSSGDPSALTVGSAHQFLQSDGTDLAYVAMSGDATLSAGALTIANNAVSLAKMAGLARGKFIYGDASGDPAALAAGASGKLLVADANGDPSWTTVSGDATLSAGALSLDAAQTNVSSIYNSGLKIGYGASDATIDFGTDNSILMDIDNSVALTINGSGVIVAGNLTVQGTTTTVDSTTINVSSSFTFEGLADDFETTLDIVDPSADRTLSLANVGGYIQPFAAASTTAITATPAEINFLDAGAGSSVALADGDGILMFDASAANVMKKVLMSDIETFVNSTNVQNVDDSGTLQVGFNYWSSLGGAESATLPASPSVGNVVQIKAAANCSSTNKITINKAGSQTIDGETAIILESPDAAVSLIYVASNIWKVY